MYRIYYYYLDMQKPRFHICKLNDLDSPASP